MLGTSRRGRVFSPFSLLVPMVVAIVWGERKGRGRGRGEEGKGRRGGRPVGTSYQGAREGRGRNLNYANRKKAACM